MPWLESIVLRLTEVGPWAPVLFVVAYVMFSITLAPAVLLSLAAGAAFGLWRGTLFVFIGALLGATAVYGLAAPLARSRLIRWADPGGRIAATRHAVGADGLWVMFLLRLSPVVPFVLLNYALALSGVPFRPYAMASVGMLPAIVLYVYYGKVAGDVAAVVTGVAAPRGPVYYKVLATGLLATLVAAMTITRAARRALQSTIPPQPEQS
jgi:uncharacterized membrane protein YdjX (TVP38/TMEM64 family)